jgi:glutamyl-tRNA synthetase
LHVGTARTAVYNWLFAKHHQGTFILRIEDTDRERSYPEMVDSIQESLKWLGLNWDEGPFFQSQRSEIYSQWVKRLAESGQAYPCYCTLEELAAKREAAQKEKRPLRYDGHCRDLSDEQRRRYEAEGRQGAWRIRIPGGDTRYVDRVYGELERSNSEIDDFICVRADGSPTYNFACVIDDHDMEISHIIRGNDHLTNTYKQILIYRALGLQPPEFAHLPLSLGKDRRKISKREGATSIVEYREMGFLPEALVNFLALLGWSPGDDREVMTIEELIKAFTLERVSASNPIFDVQKLEWMNGEYIRQLDPNELLKRLTPYLMEAGLATRLEIETRWAWMLKVASSLQERLHKLTDVADIGAFYFTDEFEYEPKGVKKHFSRPGVDGDLTLLAVQYEQLPEDGLSEERAEQVLRELAEQLQRKPAELIHPLRLAMTGRMAGPGVFTIAHLLGRDRCVERLRRAVDFIRTAPLPD